MVRGIATLLLWLSVCWPALNTREIQKIYFTDFEEPRRYVYKFEAFFVVPNALTAVKPFAQLSDTLTSPSITSYNFKSSLKWHVIFRPKVRYSRGCSVKEDCFVFETGMTDFPPGVSSISMAMDISVLDATGAKHVSYEKDNILFQKQNSRFPQIGMSWENATRDNIFSANGDLTLYFKVDAVYKYETTREPAPNLTQKNEMAIEVIDVLDLFRNGIVASDVTLRVGEAEVKCHKSVLSRWSPMLSQTFVNATFNGALDLSEELHEADLMSLVWFLYKGQSPWWGTSCFRLYRFAKTYGIPELMYECEQILKAQINSENCFRLYSYAETNEAISLRTAAAAIIAKLPY